MIREFDFISMLAQRFESKKNGLLRGIGDDCAHLSIPQSAVQLISTDMLTHGVHFSDRFMPWSDIGWRCTAVNLSDLAASGANPDLPIFLFLSLAVSPDMDKDQLTDFIDGLAQCSTQYGALLAGGDSTFTHGPFVVSITAVGHTASPVARDGASPGDRLCIFGHLGAAGIGFDILETGKQRNGKEKLTQAFLRPTPLLSLGHQLGSSKIASAMIDVSDGILADAGHIAQQSECDVEINLNALPIPEDLEDIFPADKVIEISATFGDDYALACSVPEYRLKKAEKLAIDQGIPFAIAGTFTKGSGNVQAMLGGKPFSTMKSGYQHRLGR